MKTIPLSRGEVAIVDDDDYEQLTQHKWSISAPGGRFYAQRRGGPGKVILMHRAIMAAEPWQQVDHRNHNGLDNRRSNLRFCTSSQNNLNKTKRAGCSSQYKGVSFFCRDANWRAVIRVPRETGGRGRYKHIGYFATEVEAARAYDRAARELHGEFACVNGVDP